MIFINFRGNVGHAANWQQSFLSPSISVSRNTTHLNRINYNLLENLPGGPMHEVGHRKKFATSRTQSWAFEIFFFFFFLSGSNLAIGVGATDGTEYSNGRERR